MKTAIKRCVASIVFLAIFGWLFVHISYALRGGLAHTRNNLSGYYELDEDSLDMVFVGTSGTMSGFSPMVAWEKYGFASYNFCINVLGADAMANAVHEVMKTQSPKALVIDVYPFIVSQKIGNLSDQYSRYNTDGYKYSLDRLKLIWDTFPDDWDKVPYVFDLIKYHTNAFNWENFFAEYHFVNKGNNLFRWGGNTTPAILTDERVALTDEFDGFLDKLLRECGRQEVENILFIYYPYGDVLGQDVPDIAMMNYIQDRVEAAGYPFLNCEEIRDSFGLDYQKDFWNAGHFNIYGTEKITTVLGEYFKTTYDLPDRRDDPAYAEWNEDIYLYHQNVSDSKASIDKAIAEASAG